MNETLTVSELRKLLAEYPDDLPVVATWEGVIADIKPDRFSVEIACPRDTTVNLVIDVDKY